MGWTLVADIGGTNARFAAVINGELQQTEQYRIADDQADGVLLRLTKEFIVRQGSSPEIAVAAVAGIVADGGVRLTNLNQSLSETELASLTCSGDARIINDFEAAAWSLLRVDSADLTALQGSPQPANGNRLIVGPGTGLGVGALLGVGSEPRVVPGEGGHIGISPQSLDEAEVFKAYAGFWPEAVIGGGLRVEAEAFCSGTGLIFLYQAVCVADGSQPVHTSNEAILAAAAERIDEPSVRTAELFKCYLARVAGDLSLVFASDGGVFFTGGILLANPWLLDQQFLTEFNAGGRYTDIRSATPVYLYTQTQFGLIGARNAAEVQQ